MRCAPGPLTCCNLEEHEHAPDERRTVVPSTTRPILAAAMVTAPSPWAPARMPAADSEPTDTLGEIIVTVQKREQNLQDVAPR